MNSHRPTSRARRLLHSLRPYLPSFLAAVGGIGMAAVGFFFDVMPDRLFWLTFGLAGFLFLMGTVLGVREERNFSRILEENKRLRQTLSSHTQDYFEKSRDLLSLVALGLDLDRRDRLSLYVVSKTGSYLLMVGRFSDNTNLERHGRRVYPLNQGCLGKAWAEGDAYENGFPDPDDDPEGYVECHARYGLDEATVRNLTMQSRMYCALRVEVQRGRRLGVVVVESLHPRRFRRETLASSLTEQMKLISDFIEANRSLEPDPEQAMQEGF